MELEKLRSCLLSYYLDNDLEIPNSVQEYLKNYPPGYSRQVLYKKFGLKTSDIVSLINSKYIKATAISTLISACERLNYELVDELPKSYTSKDRISIRCIKCGYINNTTLDSLRGSTKGCIKCSSGNLSWNKREEELKILLLEKFDAVLESDIPANQTGYITVRHLECNTQYTSQLVGIVSPNTKLRGTCPTCRATDRRVVYNNITFGSQFELDCYLVLEKHRPEVHVPYSKYLCTDRKWNCDFKIRNFWIEVSNFKTDYKSYFSNLENKQKLVESCGNNFFFFFNSLKDLKDFSELL